MRIISCIGPDDVSLISQNAILSIFGDCSWIGRIRKTDKHQRYFIRRFFRKYVVKSNLIKKSSNDSLQKFGADRSLTFHANKYLSVVIPGVILSILTLLLR